MSAYRVHERDPVVFQQGLQLVWRNSDELPDPSTEFSTGGATPPSWICPTRFPWYPSEDASAGSASFKQKKTADGPYKRLAVRVNFLVWAYEWGSPL